jgi:hypothetical protein
LLTPASNSPSFKSATSPFAHTPFMQSVN